MILFSRINARRRPVGGPPSLWRCAAAVAVLLLLSQPAFSQGTRGTIRGTVTDPNGAVVVNANVRLIDVARQQEVRTVQTDESGNYQFLEIEPARYSVVVTAAGFAETRLAEVAVEPNRSLELNAALAPEGASVTVEVPATAEIIDRESPTLGSTVEQRRVVGLPLDGRNVLNLALLQPGVAPVFQPTAGVTAFGSGLGIRVNGGRGVENNISLDGANNNEVAVGSSTGTQPRPDAVQEFRLLTSNFEAEFGRNTGSVINVVTKSGTNEFHGNARIFYRPTFLSAARFFDNQRTTPLRGTDDFRRTFERKEFGGNIGGPLNLPRFGEGGPAFWSGKNRTFFFADYERRAQLIGDTRVITGLPSAEELNGIITVRNRDTAGRAILIRDPETATAANPLGDPFPVISGDPSAPNSVVRQQVPSARFSPIFRYYSQFFPIPDAQGRASAAANETTNTHYLTARVDHVINNAQTLNFTLNFTDNNVLSPFPFGGPPNGSAIPGFPSLDRRRTTNYVVRHTYMLSPNLVNSFLAGYARNNQPSLSPVNHTTPREIGFTADFVANPATAGPPYVRLFDRGVGFGNTLQGPQARVAENFQLQDSVSYSRGEHRFKFGFDGTAYRQDQASALANNGIITYSATLAGNTTGDDYVDFLLGSSPTAIQFGANSLRDFRQLSGALFAQDNWRLSDTLSLSLGLRYEYTSPITDKFNRVAYVRRSQLRSQLLTSGQLLNFEGRRIVVPTGQNAPRGLFYFGDPDPDLGGTVPAGGVAKDWNNFAPRVGFAYAPAPAEGSWAHSLLGNRETVLRGGFGVYFGSVIGDTALQQGSAPGFNSTGQNSSTTTGTLANPFAPDPFPLYCNGQVAGVVQAQCPLNVAPINNPFLASQVAVFAPISSASQAIDPHIRTPYVMQYNLTLERGFGNYVTTLSYVGNRGRKLYAREIYNPALGTFIPFPEGRTAPGGVVSTASANINARRANPDFSNALAALVSAGTSDYNAFEANFQRRSVHGLLFQVAYTFSKSMADADTQRTQLDLVDRGASYGLSSDDVPHRFVSSAIYDFRFARNFRGVGRALLDGWSVGGVYTLQSGTPFSVLNTVDTTGAGGAIITFADLGEPFTNLDPRRNNNRAFNANAFRIATVPGGVSATRFRRGTSGNNQFRLKNGINNLDFILQKKTQLWNESTNIELRFEAFNALNHAQFATADLNIASPAFGTFLSTRESRVVQLAARFSF